MGLNMYLHAHLPVGKDTKAWHAITNALTEEDKAHLDDPEWGGIYASSWAFKNEPDPLFNVLVKALGTTPTTDNPSFNFERDGEGYLVVETIGYWRKQNAIHEWFVENAQGGVDECQESPPLNFELLVSLRDLCKEVLDDPTKAATLLPTQSGFFFGGTDYDEWYVQGLKETVQIIEDVLSNPLYRYKGVTLHYQSSW